jgi:hypothetical protein
VSENSSRKIYASQEYVSEQLSGLIDDTLSISGKAADAGAVKIYVDNQIAANIDNTLSIEGKFADAKATGDAIWGVRDYTLYKDQITGYLYYTVVRNGSLATCCELKELTIASMPNITTYLAGDNFDITGAKINLVRYDGAIIETDNFTYDVASPLTEDITSVKVSYIEFNKTYTINIPITVTPFDAATILADFEYTDNGDATYTITDWKGTENGEPSTRIVVPDYQQIIL